MQVLFLSEKGSEFIDGDGAASATGQMLAYLALRQPIQRRQFIKDFGGMSVFRKGTTLSKIIDSAERRGLVSISHIQKNHPMYR